MGGGTYTLPLTQLLAAVPRVLTELHHPSSPMQYDGIHPAWMFSGPWPYWWLRPPPRAIGGYELRRPQGGHWAHAPLLELCAAPNPMQHSTHTSQVWDCTLLPLIHTWGNLSCKKNRVFSRTSWVFHLLHSNKGEALANKQSWALTPLSGI